MKKLYIFLLFFSFVSVQLFSQTPGQFLKLKPKSQINSLTSSPVNPWAVSIQSSYALNQNTTTSFADNFLASGNALLEMFIPKNPRTNVYIMGNFTKLGLIDNAQDVPLKLRELSESNQGINISLAPYYVLGNPDKFNVVVYAYLGYRLNAFKAYNDTSNTIYLNQGFITPAFEFSSPKLQISEMPITVSIAGTYKIFSESDYETAFNEKKSNLTNIEGSLILPIGKSIGFLFNVLYSKEIVPSYRAGFILTSSK